jgi:hypothetical protein
MDPKGSGEWPPTHLSNSKELFDRTIAIFFVETKACAQYGATVCELARALL